MILDAEHEPAEGLNALVSAVTVLPLSDPNFVLGFSIDADSP